MSSLPALTKFWPFATNSEWNRPIPNSAQHSYKPRAIRIPSLLSLLFLFTICLTWLQILVEKTVKPADYFAARGKHDVPVKRQEPNPGQCAAPEVVSQSISSLQSQQSELCDSYTTSMKPYTTDLPPRMQSSFDNWLASYSSMEAQLEHAESCGSSQQSSSSLSSVLDQLTSSTSLTTSASASSSPIQTTIFNQTSSQSLEITSTLVVNTTQDAQNISSTLSIESTLSLISSTPIGNFSSTSLTGVATYSEASFPTQTSTELSNTTNLETPTTTPITSTESSFQSTSDQSTTTSSLPLTISSVSSLNSSSFTNATEVLEQTFSEGTLAQSISTQISEQPAFTNTTATSLSVAPLSDVSATETGTPILESEDVPTSSMTDFPSVTDPANLTLSTISESSSAFPEISSESEQSANISQSEISSDLFTQASSDGTTFSSEASPTSTSTSATITMIVYNTTTMSPDDASTGNISASSLSVPTLTSVSIQSFYPNNTSLEEYITSTELSTVTTEYPTNSTMCSVADQPCESCEASLCTCQSPASGGNGFFCAVDQCHCQKGTGENSTYICGDFDLCQDACSGPYSEGAVCSCEDDACKCQNGMCSAAVTECAQFGDSCSSCEAEFCTCNSYLARRGDLGMTCMVDTCHCQWDSMSQSYLCGDFNTCEDPCSGPLSNGNTCSSCNASSCLCKEGLCSEENSCAAPGDVCYTCAAGSCRCADSTDNSGTYPCIVDTCFCHEDSETSQWSCVEENLCPINETEHDSSSMTDIYTESSTYSTEVSELASSSDILSTLSLPSAFPSMNEFVDSTSSTANIPEVTSTSDIPQSTQTDSSSAVFGDSPGSDIDSTISTGIISSTAASYIDETTNTISSSATISSEIITSSSETAGDIFSDFFDTNSFTFPVEIINPTGNSDELLTTDSTITSETSVIGDSSTTDFSTSTGDFPINSSPTVTESDVSAGSATASTSNGDTTFNTNLPFNPEEIYTTNDIVSLTLPFGNDIPSFEISTSMESNLLVENTFPETTLITDALSTTNNPAVTEIDQNASAPTFNPTDTSSTSPDPMSTNIVVTDTTSADPTGISTTDMSNDESTSQLAPVYISPTTTEFPTTITTAPSCTIGDTCDDCGADVCTCNSQLSGGATCEVDTCFCSLPFTPYTWECDSFNNCASTTFSIPTTTSQLLPDPSSADGDYGDRLCHTCNGADTCSFGMDDYMWEDHTLWDESGGSCTIDWCHCQMEEDSLVCNSVADCNDEDDFDLGPPSTTSPSSLPEACDPLLLSCDTCDPSDPYAVCQCDYSGTCVPSPCGGCTVSADGLIMMCPIDCEDEQGYRKRSLGKFSDLNFRNHLSRHTKFARRRKPLNSFEPRSQLSHPMRDFERNGSRFAELNENKRGQDLTYLKQGLHRRLSPQARGVWGVMDKRDDSEVLSEDAPIPLRDAWNYLLWTEPLTVRRTSSSTVSTTVLATFTLDVFPGGSTSWPSLSSTPPLAIVPRTPACIPATFIQPIPTHANIKRSNEASGGQSAKAYVSREGTTVAVRIRDNYMEMTSNLPTITQSASAGKNGAGATAKDAGNSAAQTQKAAAGNTASNAAAGNKATDTKASGSNSAAGKSAGSNSAATNVAGSNSAGASSGAKNSASATAVGANSNAGSMAASNSAGGNGANGNSAGASSPSSTGALGDSFGSNSVVKAAAALQQMTTQTMVITSIGPDGVRHTQSVVVVRPTSAGSGSPATSTDDFGSDSSFGTANNGGDGDDNNDAHDGTSDTSNDGNSQLRNLSKNERIVNLPFTKASYIAALYIPAIMAVIIKVLFETMVASIKMMEPFQRLHSSQGSNAEESLCSQYLTSSISWDNVRSMWTGRSVPLWTTIIYVFISIGAPLSAASMSVKPMDNCLVNGALHPCDPAWVIDIQFIRLMEALLAICIALTLILTWASWTYHAGVPSNPTSIASIAVLLNYEPLRKDLQKIDTDATEEELQQSLRPYHFWLVPHNQARGELRYGIVHTQTSVNPVSQSMYPIFDSIGEWLTSVKPSFSHLSMVRICDSLHLFTAFALLALLTTYRANLRDDSFNRFFASNTFLPKLIIVSLASFLDMQCKNLEREVRVLEPYRRLWLGNARAESTILHTLNGTCWSNTPRCLKELFQYPNMWFEAIVGLTAILSDVNIIAVSGVLMTNSQTEWAYQFSSITALVATSTILLVVCVTVFWWRRCGAVSNLPRTPDTVGVVLSYLCTGKMAKDFADMGMENVSAKQRDEIILAKGRRYKFGKQVTEDGVARYCVDYEDEVVEEGKPDEVSWFDMKTEKSFYSG